MTDAQISKLSDRELLVRTHGKVEKIEGVLSRLVPQVNGLEKKQGQFVTKSTVKVMVGIVIGTCGIFIPIITALILRAL